MYAHACTKHGKLKITLNIVPEKLPLYATHVGPRDQLEDCVRQNVTFFGGGGGGREDIYLAQVKMKKHRSCMQRTSYYTHRSCCSLIPHACTSL